MGSVSPAGGKVVKARARRGRIAVPPEIPDSMALPARLYGPRYWPTWLGLGVVRLATWLPHGVMLAAGRALGAFARRLPLPYVATARTNIALCLPELDDKAREQLLRRHFAALGMGLMESALTWWASDARLEQCSDVVGLEHLEAALAKGHGVILLTAHFTTLQIGARILSVRRPISALYRPTKNELIARVSGGSFSRNSRQAIRHDDVRAMIGALRRNEAVWYAADQSYRNKGAVMLPFFGVRAPTNVFTPRLAALTGATVLYYATERLPSGRWRATIEPAFAHWPSDDPAADTLAYHARIEAQVRRMPEQYWWIHRRFKPLGPGDPNPYADR